ncbi:MAG: tRNA lysidine(34) synthetase TilS [Beijerinckiaceae bacterium]|nr:tRNA lysidine(34) synthetase TilS [Beijerinckiaceae bacterium]
MLTSDLQADGAQVAIARGRLATGLLAPAQAASGVLVAVSGGPDSMALLELAARWRLEAAAGAARPPLFAATVDHGLRPDSLAEARMAADFAAARGVPHEILHWTGDKPQTRLQERARAARYALLAAEARRVGADFILTAHHADDQAETILMRLVRGSAVAGLAGMAVMSPREGLTLFRPFLGVRKSALVAFCDSGGVSFVRDPSNENPRFGRTGARRLALMLEAQGLGPHEWARLARRAARAEAALAAATEAALAQLPAGPASMAVLAGFPEEIAMRCLAGHVREAGGAQIVRLERLESTWEKLCDAHRASDALSLTLAGARIKLDTRGSLHITTESPRRRGRGGATASSQSVHVNGENRGQLGA